MAKQRTKYICTNCGYESLKWMGKCPMCNQWDTFSEEVETKTTKSAKQIGVVEITKLDEIIETDEQRISTNIGEFDRVLGGGLMPGSVVLIGGDPGIGKSTLLMQAASSIRQKVLYVTGEESVKQINLRAKRLKINPENIFLLAETDLDIIVSAIEQNSPSVVVIDSIQTVAKQDFDNAPGTVTQIRECAGFLMQVAKKQGFSIILVGHVTKEGYIAGPKILEHMVDTVLHFEGERNHSYRILRSNKNRFGSTNEIGIFEMHEKGLTEILNASEIFLSEKGNSLSGSVVTASIEGTRPVLLEVQALVTPSNFGNPQRVATGFDYRRLSILLAVLEKRAKYRLSASNVFLNMAGGIKIDEPAADLAICCSIASSFTDKPAQSSMIVLGEVGLGGEVRSVGQIEKRLQEAEKLGFTDAIIPKNNLKSINGKTKINVIPVENLKEAIDVIIG